MREYKVNEEVSILTKKLQECIDWTTHRQDDPQKVILDLRDGLLAVQGLLTRIINDVVAVSTTTGRLTVAAMEIMAATGAVIDVLVGKGVVSLEEVNKQYQVEMENVRENLKKATDKQDPPQSDQSA